MKPALPDYAGAGIVNLMASLAAAQGAEPDYPELRLLPAARLAGARHVVLLAIDGLGYNFLAAQDCAPTLRAHLLGSMTSVFPPTTATAITTLHTGLAPRQHGLTGWFTYLREAGAVTAVLPFRARHGKECLSATGIRPGDVFGGTPIFDRLAVPSIIVTHKSIVRSDYNLFYSGRAERRGYDGLRQCFREVASAVKGSPGRCFVYGYYPELDGLAHVFGIGSGRPALLLAKIDEVFAELLDSLAGTDTWVILTADHGFMDTTHAIELADHPELAESLVLPLCGEPRVAYCYVHPDRRDRFVEYARGPFAPYAELYESHALVEAGWFGPGPSHPRLHERIGHYALVMREGCILKDWVLGEHRHLHIGNHGGVSEDEMRVPVVAVHV